MSSLQRQLFEQRRFLRYHMRSGSRAGEGGLGSGRQSVAHGFVAAVTDVRAVDGGEVTVGLGRRQQAAGAAVPSLGRPTHFTSQVNPRFLNPVSLVTCYQALIKKIVEHFLQLWKRQLDTISPAAAACCSRL